MNDSGLELLEDQCRALEAQLAARTKQYQETLDKLQLLEQIVSRATIMSNQISYLCSTLPEVSTDIEQASAQLHDLLTRRTRRT